MRRAGSVRRLAWWFGVLVALAAAGATARAQSDSSRESNAVGRLLPGSGKMPLLGIPASDQQPVRAIADRLWAIVSRNPAVNPPTGFDLRPVLLGDGCPLPGDPRDPPYRCSATGALYWYFVEPNSNRVQPLFISSHAFHINVNTLQVVFEHKWHRDAAGDMYWEPREMRRLGGYPQYDSGAVVVTNTSRPLWIPVTRERMLRWELDTERVALESTIENERKNAGYDPQAALDAFLRDRPKRQRDNDELYEWTKKSNPKRAEEIRAKLAKSEEGVEQALRGSIVAHAKQRPIVQRQYDQRRQEYETCVRYLEDELQRLSPAERAAPGFASRAPAPGCSRVVDGDSPGAARIVERNPAFFDRALPRTAVQVIMIDFGNFQGAEFDSFAWMRHVYERLRDGMDYQAFAAMLAKR